MECTNPLLQVAMQRGFRASGPASCIDPNTAEQMGQFRGYYLRLPDGANHWIGADLAQAQSHFDTACERHLSAALGWRYDIEFSHGYVVGAGSPWDNLSAIDCFI